MVTRTRVSSQTLSSLVFYADVVFVGGLIIMIVFLPLSESLKNIGYFIALGGWVWKRVRDRRWPVTFTPIGVFFSLFFLASLLSATFAIDRWSGFRGAWDVFRPLSLFLMIVNDVDTVPKVRFCLWSFIASTGVGVAWGLFNYFSKNQLRLEIKSLGHPNSTAPYLVIMLALLIGLLLLMDWPIPGKMAMGALAVLTLVALFLTYSRGGWAAFMACLLFFSISLRRWTLIAVATLLVIATFLSLQIAGRLYTRQIEMLTHLSQDDNARERVKIWRAAILILKDRPLLGVGPRNFRIKTLDYKQYGLKEPYRDGHSLFFHTMAEEGLLGLLALTAVFVCYAYEGIKQRHVERSLCRALWYVAMGSFITVLVAGVVNTTLESEVAIAFWSLTALMLSSSRAARLPQVGWP
ncbi:MAG: O-antigen ligase family protein [candidate division NC10 bacterium]|nr:O-antigen ligase family protein [candidate division NC10 bacterium]